MPFIAQDKKECPLLNLYSLQFQNYFAQINIFQNQLETIIQVTPTVEKYYDSTVTDTYDKIDSTDFKTKVKGASTYTLCFWFKSGDPGVGFDAAIAHLTMLDTYKSWDYGNQPSDIQHLSNMIFIEQQGTSSLKLYISDFTKNNVVSISISVNTWYFLYVGVDFLTPLYSYYLYNPANIASSIPQQIVPAAGISNEQLDDRVRLYIGGTVDRLSASSKCGFQGIIYNAKFITNFQVNSANADYVMNGDTDKLYYFNLNQPCKTRIYSNYDQNIYATFFVPSVNIYCGVAAIPEFTITQGVKLESSEYFTLNLNSEFDNMNFISMWIFINNYPAAGQTGNIFSILNSKNQKIVAISIKDDGTLQIESSNPTVPSSSSPLDKQKWVKFYCNFSYFKVSDFLSVTLMIQDTVTDKNIQIGTLPVIRTTTQTIQIGGNQFQANIQDIYGGEGSFLGRTSVGITNPLCIYCDSGYYQDNSGAQKCALDCPDGYYRDQDARMCRKCHESCLTCIGGPQDNQCTSCGLNFPLSFESTLGIYCFNLCPIGTYISTDGSNKCLCHETCKECELDSTNKQKAKCNSCKEESHYIVEYSCVIDQLCPYGLYADKPSQKCVGNSSCNASNNIIDEVNRKCVSFCPINTTYDDQKKRCLLDCPDTYYKLTYSGPNSGETTFICDKCDPSCNTCIEKKDKCLSCNPPKVIYEYIGTCEAYDPKCGDKGFVPDGDKVCRICQKDCTKCPTDFYLQEKKCIPKCDKRYTANNLFQCIPNTKPIVEIFNKTQVGNPDFEALKVGRQKDIMIISDSFYIGAIKEIQWFLSGDSEKYSQQLFSKTFNNAKNLIIPKNNLNPNVQYELNVRVFGNSGEYGEDKILIKTSSEIIDGEYTANPQTGISGVTEFTVFYKLWLSSNALLYDLTYSKETKITFRNEQILFKDDVHQVFVASKTDGSVTFKFPPFKIDKVIALELSVYNDEEVKIKKIIINLKKFNGDLITMESDVRRFEPSDTVTIAQYLEISYKLTYLFTQIQADETMRLYHEEILRQNQLYKLTSSFCSEDVSCNGQGLCQENFYDPQMFQCKCDDDSSGDYCSWDEKILKIVNLLTYNIQISLLNKGKKIVQSDLLAVSQILKNIVSIQDGLSKKTFRFIMNLLDILQTQVFPRQEIFSNILQTIQELLYQATNRPSLRPDERYKYIVLLRDAISKFTLKFKTQNIQLNTDYIFHFSHSNIYLTKQNGRELQNNPTNYGKFFTLPMERVITQIPFETFEYTDIITIEAIEWNIDLIYPRPNSTTNHIELTLLSNAQPLSIQSLGTNKVIHHFQKKAGFPPLRTDYTSQYFCAHIDVIDFSTTKWNYDSKCKFVFENEFYIRCECDQLDQATTLRGTIEYYDDLPDDNILEFYSAKHMNKVMKFIQTSQNNFDSNIPIAMRPYAEPNYPDSYVPFKWDSPAFILFVIFIVVFLVFHLINFLRIKIRPPKEYPSTSKDILLLTYHPFISMVMFGHTSESHTYQMRLAKFFSVLVGMLAMNAVAFEQLAISIPLIKIRQRVIGSAFSAILLNASMNYCIESLYYLIKRHIYKEKRQENVYSVLFFLNMLGNAAFGTWCNGYTDKEDYGNFVLAFIISLLVDYFIFDIFVLSYAFYEIDSTYLQFFAFRGFYICPSEKMDKDQYEIIGYKKSKYVDLNELELDKIKAENQDQEELARLDPGQAIDKAHDQLSQNQRPLSSHSKKSQTSNKIFPSKTNVP